MKRLLQLAIVLLAIFSSALFAASPNNLETNFKSPPASAKPHTWWHWMNGNATAEGITADLEAMAEIGIGGAQLFNVADKGSVNIPDGPAPFMSPHWLDLVKHAAVEANRLGLELCLHNCAGWSSTGGPWITPDQSMQMVVYKETKTTGPANFNQTLPQPQIVMNHYRDIAILAFPTPKNDTFRIDDLQAKTGLRRSDELDPNLADTPADASIALDSVIDLTAKTDAKGLLQWQVPQGSWTIIRIGHTSTGKTNHPAPVAGRGLECDKLSTKALDLHWEKGIKPILEKLGNLAPKTLNNILIDSYEVGKNNWTPKMASEFKKRTGYDLIKYLPTFAGRVIQNAQTTERFLWDFRQVNSQLFAENYFGYFAEKCRKNGFLSSVEPYGGPFECAAVGAKYDIIMGEFWISSGNRVGLGGSLKIAATTAHTHGQKYVGAESFTAQPQKGRWQNHPASMKILGDQVYCTGINRFIFHRYAMQPWTDKLPGMTMGQWGTNFDRTNTWWKQGKPWMTYLARSQYMLQQGRFAADVLFFTGESTPSGISDHQNLVDQGYDYDLIGTDLIHKLTVKDGLLTLPSKMQYKLLVLPNTTFMTPKLAKKIKKLVKAGAVIIGPKPKTTPSLTNFPKSQAQLKMTADQLWGTEDKKIINRIYGKGRIIAGTSPQDVLKDLNIQPDFIDHSKKVETSFIHRKTKQADIYFVASRNKKQNTTKCSFRITGKQPEIWNPETATIEPAPLFQVQNNRTIVAIDFPPSGSMFVVFRNPIDKTCDSFVSIESKVAPKPVKKSTDTLEILKAEYGLFTNTRRRTVDVTQKLTNMIKDNKLRVKASNNIAGDPAASIVKTLYVTYSYGDKKYTAKAKEGKTLKIPHADIADKNKKLKIIAAVYGKLPSGQNQVQPPATIDITKKVAAKVKDGSINVLVDNNLAGSDPAQNVFKQLKVTYVFNGETKNTVIDERNWLHIPSEKFELTPILSRLAITPNSKTLTVSDNGQYILTKASGMKTSIQVTDIPNPVKIEGPWQLNFTPGWKAPEKINFPKLISWTKHEIKDIRYYSGTAKYHKQFNIPKEFFAADTKIILDLGQVLYLADVKLNGQNLGTLWKQPFHIDITSAAKPGKNKLELAVTNLWPNRLIGDEQYPDDCQWTGQALKDWPDWLKNNQPRPSKERLTFTTWKQWKKDDPLIPSGLIGPVTIKPVKLIPVTD